MFWCGVLLADFGADRARIDRRVQVSFPGRPGRAFPAFRAAPDRPQAPRLVLQLLLCWCCASPFAIELLSFSCIRFYVVSFLFRRATCRRPVVRRYVRKTRGYGGKAEARLVPVSTPSVRKMHVRVLHVDFDGITLRFTWVRENRSAFNDFRRKNKTQHKWNDRDLFPKRSLLNKPFVFNVRVCEREMGCVSLRYLLVKCFPKQPFRLGFSGGCLVSNFFRLNISIRPEPTHTISNNTSRVIKHPIPKKFRRQTKAVFVHLTFSWYPHIFYDCCCRFASVAFKKRPKQHLLPKNVRETIFNQNLTSHVIFSLHCVRVTLYSTTWSMSLLVNQIWSRQNRCLHHISLSCWYSLRISSVTSSSRGSNRVTQFGRVPNKLAAVVSLVPFLAIVDIHIESRP